MSIKGLLIDADGVIQQISVVYSQILNNMVCSHKIDKTAFMSELFQIERPCLIGKECFPTNMANMLRKWNCFDCYERVLKMWTEIEPVQSVLATIVSLKSQGYYCALASNQEKIRANYMSSTLGYCRLFSHEFYSYQIGFVKPQQEYFKAILTKTSLSENELLFIDDNETNVESAKSAGLNAVYFRLSDSQDNGKAFKTLIDCKLKI